MSRSKLSPRRQAITSFCVLGVLAVLLFCGAHLLLINWMWWRAALPRAFADRLSGPRVSRAEMLAIAKTYAEHAWAATAQNARHSPDAHGVDVQTPDGSPGQLVPGMWRIGPNNVGIPYKWGGFDTPESFDAGVASGKAAGDVYTSEKRRLGNAAVSNEAVGIDCSGFISRC